MFTGPGAAFGTDALLLARFAMPRRKETALDLCSGCGIVALAWHDAGHRGPCTAVELDADASALCRRDVQETPGAEHITALCTDLRTFCKSGPEQGKYDFAACNPPYFTGGYVSPDARRATARHDGSCTMQDVAACAARALHDGGKLALCHRPEQMAAVFAALCAVGLEPKRVALVRKDEHSKPWLFLVEAQKGRKPGIRWRMFSSTFNADSTSSCDFPPWILTSMPTPQASCSWDASYKPNCLGCRW